MEDRPISHFYSSTGEPRHFTPYKTKKGTRASTKKDAKSNGWYPSFSAIKEVIANPALNRWIVNQHIDACCNLSRFAGEPIDTYKARVKKEASQTSKDATDFGSAMHEHLERWNLDPSYTVQNCPYQAITEPILTQWSDWSQKNVQRVLSAEETVTVPYVGLGGTIDLWFEHKELGLCVGDYKSANVKPEHGPAFWPSFGWQLATYAMMKKIKLSLDTMPRIVSFVIDSNGKFPLAEKIYTNEEQAKCWFEADLARLLYFSTEDWWPDGVCRELIPY